MSSVKISLVVATLGRTNELSMFLNSLVCQLFNSSDFEVIIVDQNDNNLIDALLDAYIGKLNLIHIKSKIKGLSYNRNLGIQRSLGKYICVPDDDCTYYPDTLAEVWHQLEALGFPDMIIGKVFDRATQKYIFKKTPTNACHVHWYNFYPLVSSITLFFKRNEIQFNEHFGIGAAYASNEDAEIILSFLKEGKRIIYSPLIECNHPPYSNLNMSKEKLFAYGVGFGALCRKYLSLPILLLLFKVLVYQCIMLFKSVLLLDKQQFGRRWYALKGRLFGFIRYSS